MAVESDYFRTLVNQIDPMISQTFFRENPFASLIAQKAFDTSQGVTPTAVSHTGTLPTSYPYALAGINIDNGPGSPSGDVTATTVDTGQNDRTYALEVDAWDSNEINQDDMTFKKDPIGTVQNVVDSLAHYTVVRNSDWIRVKNIAMLDNKVVVKSGGALSFDSNQDSDFEAIVVDIEGTAQAGAATTITLAATASAVDDAYNGQTIGITAGTGVFAATDVPLAITDYDGTTKVATVTTSGAWPVATPDATSVYRILTTELPGDRLDWDIMPHFYNALSRNGAKKYAVGQANGKAVYSLTLGPEEQKRLYKDEKQTDIRYYDPKANFMVRGITGSVDGFMPNEDDFAIRYDALFRPIYPTVNTTGTRGGEYTQNPLYDLATNTGGAAVYEVFTILAREAYEIRPRPLNPAGLGRAQFAKAQDYMAELIWNDKRTYKGDNDRGNKGYYRADWQKAAKPVRPQNGFTGLLKLTA